MESVTLPTIKAPASKTYKHYSVNSSPESVQCNLPETQTSKQKKVEFFYVGRNAQKIEFLIQALETGYAVENVTKAISILKRIAEKRQRVNEITSCPDVIIFDGSLGESALIELHQFLSCNSTFAGVPFIVDITKAQEHECKRYTRLQFLDEIIDLEQCKDNKLKGKIEFLIKIKNQPGNFSSKNNLETTVDGIRGNRYFGKRLFDIIVSALAILILSPVFLLIALLIKLESRGPVFYIADRAGRGYRIFKFFKFRTMRFGADKEVDQLKHLNQYDSLMEGPVFFKVSNDPRITKIGAFLRNTSLDELPQLFNVLLGDMSLVGNRPLPLYEAATLTTDQWAARFLAPAGITGLWQTSKRGHDKMSVQERINLDIKYANEINFMNDLRIMAITPFALIQKSNV